MNSHAPRSRRSQRLLSLTVITASVALFGAVVVADGIERLFLGSLAVVLFLDVVKEIRKPGSIQRQTEFVGQPAGPWLVSVFVFVALNAIAVNVIRDRTHDATVAFLLSGVSLAVSFGIGRLVRSALLRLPRYREAAIQR
jgi:hypothetical protein